MPNWERMKNRRKNHIKYVFLLRSKPVTKYSKNSEIPKYLFAYLTDDNKVFFDEFHVRDRKYFMRGTVCQFIKKVKKHFINSSTQIYYWFGEGRYEFTDIMFMLWQLYHFGIQCNMTKSSLGLIVNKLSIFFKLGHEILKKDPRKMEFNTAVVKLNDIYDTILKNRVCPWINDDFNQRIELIKPTRRRMYKIVTLGLLYMVVKDIVNKNIKA